MKLNFKIPIGLKEHMDKEIVLSFTKFKSGSYQMAWRHLERAHILGQAWPVEHTRSHCHMLIFAVKVKNTKETIGQLPRLIVGGVKSFVGKIPVGNTGGANVPPLKPMEIPDDLKQILDQYK